MSDFLSNLIARSFIDAPLIQPRVPSLFETVSDEFFDGPQSVESAMGAPETIAPANGPAAASNSLSLKGTLTAKPVATVFGVRAEQHQYPLKPDVPADENATVAAQPPQSGEQTTEVKTKRIIVPVSSFRAEEKETEKKERLVQAFSEPRQLHSRRRKDFSSVEPPSSTSPPIIRVTIGRVEVRAIHPPPSAPTPAKPTPPKISLEDYLQERQGSSR
jgi:hypothetical protein